ncbi:hypothetical protein FEM48_Zijuj10G0100900 [Ziziphus jujuba var. spinosa]|uniref:Pterin-binding domain-containing protein n=1 Tax=Ziziphus jujuba var. spinosa TaxID=714518 RepID=A0A978UMR5_ZIZJJ|nr:hypothetical protein FEM48_Zijuj10G0100900 [Ziziphus jujuba var. spinosa]
MNIFKQLARSKHGLNGVTKYCKGLCSSSLNLSANASVEVHFQEQEVVIALGSNVGDRLHNFNKALQLMKKAGIKVTKHACLYESAPAYITDQPYFLNSAVRASTKLGPHELLGALKKIEQDMGRTGGIRYGPRPIDLDILFHGNFKVNSDILTKMGGDSLIGKEGLKRVLPIGNGLWDWTEKTSVMGILNLTPDSFSDGGKFQSVEAAVSQVRLMVSEGADMIDIGAQSTRPMASRISPEEEMDRLIPVLEAILGMPEIEGKLLDSDMFRVVAGLEVPYIAMHMRGDPSTMQNSENLQYDNVCNQVASELYSRVRNAELLGIPAWRIITDPGIGFSKNTEQNLEILVGLPNIRAEIARKSLALSHAPLLIGPSRKKFLGEICGRPSAVERDPATVASITAAILGGANIVRVHNVRDNLDATKLCDAMLRQKRSSVLY